MAFTVNKRQLILGVASALTLAAVLTLQGKDEPDAVISQPVKGKSAHPERSVDSEVESTGETQLAKLNRQVLSEDVKEMFSGKSWYVPPPPPPPPPPRVEIPEAPPFPFVFKGKIMEEGEKVAVFLNKQGRSFIVRQGDVLDKTYSVDEVNPPEMILTYLPLKIKQTIQIGETN